MTTPRGPVFWILALIAGLTLAHHCSGCTVSHDPAVIAALHVGRCSPNEVRIEPAGEGRKRVVAFCRMPLRTFLLVRDETEPSGWRVEDEAVNLGTEMQWGRRG